MRQRHAVALVLGILLGLLPGSVTAQESLYVTERDIPYYDEAIRAGDEYIRERCKLDIHYPRAGDKFSTIVWFHAGGLTAGEKSLPEALTGKGIAIVSVNYRLSPRVKTPSFIEDAAAAVAWTFRFIGRYGGDSKRIFLSGHSAGGYLIAIVGMDKRWLAKHNIDADSIAGLIPLSGHMITHFTTRTERGIPGERPVIDEYAPLYHVRADAPPLLLITGDRELELLGRYEENAYMMRMMRVAGHTRTTLYELGGYGHGMTEPAFPLVVKQVRAWSEDKVEGR